MRKQIDLLGSDNSILQNELERHKITEKDSRD